jgi:hypothetical protein
MPRTPDAPDPLKGWTSIGKAQYSVLTSADVDTPGHPTRQARAEVPAFLRERLARTV